MDTGSDPQVVIAAQSGNVYALWLDGTNHIGGAVANVWTCAENEFEYIYSTPTLCSLDGSTLSMIVGSTKGIYKINLYQTTAFEPGSSRWPWPTFHHNKARTGCTTAPSTTMVSSSIVGRVKTSSGYGLEGASVEVQWYDTSTSTWVASTPVYGRPTANRTNPILTVGNSTQGDEVNEGGYIINQLTPDRRYRLVISKSGYTTQTVSVNSDQAVPVGKTMVADITLQ
jgi:hypothetical protein